MALHASSLVGTLRPTLAPTVVYILCLARSHWQRVGAGACDEDLGLNLTKRGLAVPAAADSERPASGVAAASGPELGRIPADRPGHWQKRQGLRVHPCRAGLLPVRRPGGAGWNLKLPVLAALWYYKWFMLFMSLDMPDEGTR